MSRITLSVDAQKRVSVGKLGFTEGLLVADPLPDEQGWVLRPAKVLTQAELDVASRQSNFDNIEQGLSDLRAGRTTRWNPATAEA
jgi:hypothetical protein